MVDLRAGRRAPSADVELWASPGAELVRATAAMTRSPCNDFDVGDDRLAELADRLDDDLRAALDGQPEQSWLFVTSLVALLDEPGTVEDLLALLRDEPVRAWRTLFDAPLGDAAAQDPDVVDRYLAGELDAATVAEMVEQADDRLADMLGPLLEAPPETFVQRLHDILAGIHDTIGSEMLTEAMGPMQREVAARRRELDDGRPVGELVLEATNGYELSDDLPVDRVLLLPSYWFRPWLIINRVGRIEVLTSPVADEHLALPSAAPPPGLVKLCKALGDEGRLRLLRRMAGGSISLADAMAELDVAKTTAHHHLSILRQAGLVVIRGEGRDSRYAVRAHAPTTTAAALEEYLGATDTSATTARRVDATS